MTKPEPNTQDVALPFSCHCFAWPFQVVEAESGHAILDPFAGHGYAEALERGPWHRMGPNKERSDGPAGFWPPPYDGRTRYAIWQYLGTNARHMFADVRPSGSSQGGRTACRMYALALGEGTSSYRIEHQPYGKAEPDIYDLRVVGVELHLYATGCGVLWVRTENLRYYQLDDIQNIADYGRRVAVPFLPAREDQPLGCADRVTISLSLREGEVSLSFDGRATVRSLMTNGEQGEGIFPEEASLRELPGAGRISLFDRLLKADGFGLTAPSDDRMFELEAVLDDGLSSELAHSAAADAASNPSHLWDKDCPLQRRLYELVHVDPAGGLSDQDAPSRSRKLEEAIYPRWLGYGTLHAATGYSLLLITAHGEQVREGVVKPFLTEYLLLASLALAQRTAIATCEEELFRVVGGDDTCWPLVRERYAVLRAQLDIRRASEQEQGIEIYDLVRGRMGIQEDLSHLEGAYAALRDCRAWEGA